MNSCDHIGYRRYTRRVFSNGTTHICVQCTRCFHLMKLPEHGMRPFLRLEEVPPGKEIHQWINPEEII